MIQRLDPEGIGEVQHQTIALMLYKAGYGKIQGNVPEPGEDIRYDETLYEFDHPWSISHRAYQYAFYELEEVFGDIGTYLNFNPKVASEVIKGIRKGAMALNEEKRRRANNSPKSQEQRDLESELSNLSNMNLSSGS
ncbi:hypothetical protein [Vibrio phage phiKT1028]|nr:hypothetical protein [Vibrio phage phiKT1028]